MTVRLLNPTLINQIAAGEVIERPASALKELLENALDAGATLIDVRLRDGGRTFLSMMDNGCGMSREDLMMAVERHATSKIPDEDLFNIRTLGFRGEALPSIGSVSRLGISTRRPEDDTGWKIQIEGGVRSEPVPVPHAPGTYIEIRDLFYATPARLKFLKTERTELTHIVDIMGRLALVNPQCHIRLKDQEKTIFDAQPGMDLYRMILGKDFAQDSILCDMQHESLRLKGRIGLPICNRSSSKHQYLFVNGRAVKDRVLSAAFRAGYQDVLPGNRHPVGVLFLECSPEEVDVNVHPAKAEVRFRDAQAIRRFVVGSIRSALAQQNVQDSAHLTAATLEALKAGVEPHRGTSQSSVSQLQYRKEASRDLGYPLSQPRREGESSRERTLNLNFHHPHSSQADPALHERSSQYHTTPVTAAVNHQSHLLHRDESISEDSEETTSSYPLGFAKAQILGTYILSQTSDGLVLVDQHAAHERLVYERMKRVFASQDPARQSLLIPVILELSPVALSCVQEYLGSLESAGFKIEVLSHQGIVVREIPAILREVELTTFLKEFADALLEVEVDAKDIVAEKVYMLLADKACRNSIRAGRRLTLEDMNALLREIESTPFANSCNHGRPTFIKLSQSELEKLFERG